MDVQEEYIQRPNKNNDLSFEQAFMISNVCDPCLESMSFWCFLFDLRSPGDSAARLSQFEVWQSTLMLDRMRYITVKFRCLREFPQWSSIRRERKHTYTAIRWDKVPEPSHFIDILFHPGWTSRFHNWGQCRRPIRTSLSAALRVREC